MGDGEESILLLDEFEEFESNRNSGGVLCVETEDNLWKWPARVKPGRSCLGDCVFCVRSGLEGGCFGLTANEGQSLSFKIEIRRSRGL